MFGQEKFRYAAKHSKESRRSDGQKDDCDLGRRHVLKIAAGLAALPVVVQADKISDWIGNLHRLLRRIEESDGRDNRGKDIGKDDIIEEPTSEQEEILSQDIMSVADRIDFNNPQRIEFSEKTVKEIENYWRRRYQDDPKLKNSFEKAYYEMGAWREKLETIFQEEDVPIEYCYLAIPESHWNTRARSKAAAVGPYQFIKSTGTKFGLSMDNGIDDRCDPLKSARACAQLLRSIYDVSGDWRLALSGYNGGFIWSYLKQCRKNKILPKYDDYLNFVEGRLIFFKDVCRNKAFLEHHLGKGESLDRVARKYNINLAVLARFNRINARNRPLADSIIKIPLPKNINDRKDFYDKLVGGYVENLNYPGKFMAIKSLIGDGVVKEQKNSINYRIYKIRQEQMFQPAVYQVKSGDTLYGVCKKFKIRSRDLLKNNRIGRQGLLVGQRLSIPHKADYSESLFDLTRKLHADLEHLKELNPAIINPRRPLPLGYAVRF
jgi:membrane-bound lytic murein transglycosylase D